MITANKRMIAFLVLFLLLLSVLLYNGTIQLLPSFIHAWTQSERYAIALQFLENGFDLFHPATFNLQTVEGITRVDLPLNEFIVALLMKIFGSTSPVIFRMYTLCISITGLIYLYLLAKRITSSDLKSWMVVLFVFLSPLYMYYQAGFIPCVPAISFVFIALYFFYRYKQDAKRKQFYWSIFFFFLAAMIRLPFLIFLLAVFLQQLYLFIRQRKFIRFEFFGFVIVFGLFGAYYTYNVHLGILYGNMFLDDFLPAKSFTEFILILRRIYDHWLFQYFTVCHYLLLITTLVYTIKHFRKNRVMENKAMWFTLLISGGGAVLYFLLMACQYYDHDYYFLDSLFVPLVLLFILSVHHIPLETEKNRLIVFFFFCISFIFMYGDSRKNQFERYTFQSWDRVEITRRNFMDFDKFLDSIGIAKDAKMLVIDSYSTNIPLYLMKRKGYTVYQTIRDNAAFALFRWKWDYVVIQDQFLFSDVLRYYPVVGSVIEPVAGNGKITVYRHSKTKGKKKVVELQQLNKKEKVFFARYDFHGRSEGGHFSESANVKYSELYKSDFGVLDAVSEFSVSFSIGANELKKKSNLRVLVSCDIIRQKESGIQMVATITNEDKMIYYQGYKLSDYYEANTDFSDGEFYFVLPKLSNANDILKIYLWNPKKENALYDNFEVTIYNLTAAPDL